ncbi:MAG: hypothetical protein DI563_07715 [Variovorax paradoxus]|uniref:DNA-binding response regulator n=1 Tax=Variovorax paradoxus TaxID=34073 RepID=A0A2W5QFY8_VARPD|nr:MAG: hypothetical protein DI563_07715 [Variovorax paradoxus]
MPHVLIVDDHPFVAGATRDIILKKRPDMTVQLASDVEQARQALSQVPQWDLILLDLEVPGARDLSFAQELRAQGLHTRTCVLTGNNQADFISKIRAWKFLGYVLKASPYQHLEFALQRLLDGRSVYPTEHAIEKIEVPLTRRQLQVLRLIAQGLNSKDMAKVLGIAPGTADLHRTALLEALNVKTASQAVDKGVQLGLIRVATDDRPEDAANLDQGET